MTTNLLQTMYVDVEGRPSMESCIRASFEFCREQEIGKVVLFTGNGDGAMFAVDNFLTREAYAAIQMVAVTPPSGKLYRSTPGDNTSKIVSSGVPAARREFLKGMGVPVVSAHMPFKISGASSEPEWNPVAEAFGILGGGFSLCIQAVLMACDAGEVEMGERVVAASADTSIVALAARTELFLAPHHGLLVEHVVCRPKRFNISKPKHVALSHMGAFPGMSFASAEDGGKRYIDTVAHAPALLTHTIDETGGSDDDEDDDSDDE